jgi:hypothetical protein
MPRVGIVVALSLTIGVHAQSCDVGDFTIDDLSDKIVVTNASASQTAFVLVVTSSGNYGAYLKPGGQTAFTPTASTDYRAQVGPADGASAAGRYHRGLPDLRDRLQEISLTPEAPGSDIAGALTELYLVQKAVTQMDAGSQTCKGKGKSGVDNGVTINSTDVGGTSVWVLSCG